MKNVKLNQILSNLNRKNRIILGILLLLLITGVGYKLLQPKTYNMTISLVYQEASQGLNPNGTRHNPYLMLSEEVLKPIEDELNIEIKDQLWIRPSTNAQGKSIATEYTVHCNKLPNCPLVLKKLAESYSNYFETHYTMNDSILNYVEPDKDLDYLETVDYLEKEVNKLTTFITKQIKKDGSWYSAEGKNYQDLLEYGNNILNIDIENLRAFITENGLSRNATQLKEMFAYRNLLLDLDRQRMEQQYLNRRTAITLYDPTLFPTISVPSIKSGEYYVTTTKTGLDYIYDAASLFSENTYLLQRTISKNELIIRNMTETNINLAVNRKVADIEMKIKYLINETTLLDNQYKEEKRTQYIIFGEVE